MAMRPCDRCLENGWTFELPDAVTVRATCNFCGHEVEFTTAKLQRRDRRRRTEPPTKFHFSEAEIRDQEGDPPW